MLTKLGVRPGWYLVAGLVVLAAMVAAPTKPASATTYTVTKTEDTADGICDADCSLREAIIAANGNAGADTITVPAGTYTLSIAGMGEDAAATGDLDVTGDLTINGAGAANTIADGGAIDRVLHIPSSVTAVAISGVTVQNGSAPYGGGIRNSGTAALTSVTVSGNTADFGGGGIFNEGGTVTLTNSTISGNTPTEFGGGVDNYFGTVTLTNSTVSDNTATNGGGGIFNEGGTVTLTNSTVSGNTASYGGGIHNDASGTLTLADVTVSGNTAGYGGGVYSYDGTVTLTNSTVSGNTADFDGGGVYNFDGTLTLTNATVSANTATNSGGGVANGGTATLTNVTVSGNTSAAGGGIYSTGPTMLTNTIASSNTALYGNCYGATITSGGHNLDSDGSCGLAGTGDLSNTDSMLGPLADNGGPTLTYALLPDSPAIDAGDDGACPETDQRGVIRPQGGACDIGAFELTRRGDVDCNGTVDSVDALKLLRHVAGLSVSQQPGCPAVGTGNPVFGDVDCSDAVNSVDALKLLRYVAGLIVSQTEPCPDVGTPTGGG